MGYYTFPHTRTYDSDLGWLICQTKKLLEMYDKWDQLPDMIKEILEEYIQSGEINEIIEGIIGDFILNPKYPPSPDIPKASGDGSTDDTASIQGCIDYAAEHGKLGVYFPTGAYLTRSLTLKDGVSLFGSDRYTTKLVLKAGATSPLLSGNVSNMGIYRLTLDSNAGNQVNNITTVSITAGTDIEFNDLIFASGYVNLSYLGTSGHLQLSNIIFANAVFKHLLITGTADVQAENLMFENLSAVSGNCCMDISSDSGHYQFTSNATAPVCIRCSGSDNRFEGFIRNAVENVVDTGSDNDYIIYGQSQTETLSGDRKITAANLMETVAGDRTSTVGNETVTATGNITMHCEEMLLDPTDPLMYREVVTGQPFSYVEMQSKTGSPYKLLASTGDNFDILPILDVTKYGVLPDGSDISDTLNNLIATYGDKYTIYLKKGTYTASKTITIHNYMCKFVCDGTIKSSADVAINVLTNEVQIDICKLQGTGVSGSTGILIGGELTEAIGNGDYHFQMIDNFDNGIILKGNHGFGVQNNNFYLNRIDHFKVGITIACGDGASWVNENRFYNGWLFGYEGNEGTEVGVKFIKGTNQTDPFNGNRFINMSCEGCSTMFNLSFAQRNSFIDFRMIEQAGEDQIVCANDCSNNLFTSVNAMATAEMFDDQSTNNLYKIRLYKDNLLICDSFTFAFGVLMPLDSGLIFKNTDYTFSGTGGVIPADSAIRYLTLINSTSAKMTVVLPLCVNYPEVLGNGFYIETGDITGEIEVQLYGGQVFMNSINTSGLTGFQLKAWTRYLVACVDVLTWKIVSIPNVPTGVTITTTASGKVTETQQAVEITAASNGTFTY